MCEIAESAALLLYSLQSCSWKREAQRENNWPDHTFVARSGGEMHGWWWYYRCVYCGWCSLEEHHQRAHSTIGGETKNYWLNMKTFSSLTATAQTSGTSWPYHRTCTSRCTHVIEERSPTDWNSVHEKTKSEFLVRFWTQTAIFKWRLHL